MPSKNNLSSFKVNSKNTLLNIAKQPIPTTAWRKPKPVTEKQSELIGLRFTISELEQIKAKAWLIPIATFIKNELQTKTDILD